jgi:FkbM family methyltransferase
VWAALWLPTRRRLGRPHGRPLSLRVAKEGREFDVCVRELADLSAVGEVLLDDLYDVPGLRDVHVVVDLGSHIGTSIMFFRQRHPDAAIHGFEPDPHTFARLRANVGDLDGVTIDPRAASGTVGDAVFHPSGNSLASSLVGSGRGVRVGTVTLDAIMDELGIDAIDLLKIDVEGAEYDVLASSQRLGDVRVIVGEFHPRLTTRTPEEFFSLLSEFRVRIDEFSDASWQFQAVRD